MSSTSRPRPKRAPRNPYSQTSLDRSLTALLDQRPTPVIGNKRTRSLNDAEERPRQRTRVDVINPQTNPVTVPGSVESDLNRGDSPQIDQENPPQVHVEQPEIPSQPPATFEREPGLDSTINEIQRTAKFIKFLRAATLDNSCMSKEAVTRLRNPQPEPFLDTEDKHFQKALESFLAVTNASEETYNRNRRAMMRCYPDDPFLSFEQMKSRVEQLSGISPIWEDMCIDSCVGFTGHFAMLNSCPVCGKARY
ncbi:hypothetical protein BDZ94DRAFT_1321619 [Collybia nuda]|uniref:Uncharacterized protein n=1 Tax=Collybia nuda TaxID=64659 RepID=A0A9P5Y5H8_9AGAR|nr:hypothetical protein BDZ94DRAFT_1321619 [Collybia nuda]